jgi:hypothetical protein
MIVCDDRAEYPPDGTVCAQAAWLPPLRVGRVGELRLPRWNWGLKLGMRQRIEAIIDTLNGQPAHLVHQHHNWTFAYRLRPLNHNIHLGRPGDSGI